ncbi:MAG: DUF4373 domain-containing protein [Bacteroidaceae bacterium]|nr:DUF4373 domain-containing protein [Bacteroidaceae bacterium]
MYNYLPWPSNMRTADHVLSMRIQEGAAGYGIYVMLLELLRDSETRSLVCNPKNLAFAINEPDIALVERVIRDYGLFEVAPDGAFRSPWLIQQLEDYDAKKEAAREAGRKGAARRYGKQNEATNTSDRVPIGTPCPPPSVPYSNITNNINENKIKPTKSKLANLEFDGYTGDDLISLARTIQPPVDDITRRWAEGKQKELDAQRGAGKHNLDALIEVCDHYKLGEDMFTFLLKFTNLGQVGNPGLVKLIAIYTANKKENFAPKYPAEYLLVKLLEP